MKTKNDSLEILIRLAEDAIYDGDCIQAERLLKSGLLEEPGYARLHYTLGWMYNYHLEDNSKAENHYLWAIYFDPLYEDAYRELAFLYFDNREYKALKALMNKLIKKDAPGKVNAYNMLGKVAEAEAEFSIALKYYRKALMDCLNNDFSVELKQNIKRIKFKRFKTRFKRWQQTD